MEIPLTSFLDFVLKSGTQKMTCAKKIKAQLDEPYDPAKDYYKRFRDAIQELHKKNMPKSDLIKLVGSLPATKINNYKSMIAGYKKFLGNKQVTWFNPPKGTWSFGEIAVPVNPEVGLAWNSEQYCKRRLN